MYKALLRQKSLSGIFLLVSAANSRGQLENEQILLIFKLAKKKNSTFFALRKILIGMTGFRRATVNFITLSLSSVVKHEAPLTQRSLPNKQLYVGNIFAQQIQVC